MRASRLGKRRSREGVGMRKSGRTAMRKREYRERRKVRGGIGGGVPSARSSMKLSGRYGTQPSLLQTCCFVTTCGSRKCLP